MSETKGRGRPRKEEVNGILETEKAYASTFCTWCGVTFEYEEYPNEDGTVPVRRFCSQECSGSHAARVQSDHPDQVAIRAYLERMKDHPGWEEDV